MGSGMYGIGVSTLRNAQLGLATTSHNIANATTEGYNRQRIIQVSNVATLTGAGYVGQGAHVSTIERIYSSFLAKQVYTAQTSVSELESYATSISDLNKLLSDKDAGLASALEGFFKGVNQVSSDPSSLTTRQSMVSAAKTLASRFQSLDAQVDAQFRSINSQVQGYVDNINSYAEQVAALNKQIINAEAATNQPPNDLYDQRDQLIEELNKLIGVQTTTNSNGSLNVYFGNGQQLVVGTTATKLAAVAASGDASRLTVGIVNSAGTQELPESVISGGALAGILKYRSETLDGVANELGRIAASTALTLNAQHALGQDLLGNIEGNANFVADFFTLGSPSVIANTNNPAGSATISADFLPPSVSSDGTFYTNLTTSDYRLDVDASGNLSLTRLSDNVTWPSSTSPPITTLAGLNSVIAGQGFDISLDSGAFQPGSSYLIQPTRNAAQGIKVNDTIAADVRQIAAAAPIRASVGAANTGTATISAGSVVAGYVAPTSSSPVPLVYSASAGGVLSSVSSYPVTVTDSSATTTTFNSGAVSYSAGDTLSFAGESFTISGTLTGFSSYPVAVTVNGATMTITSGAVPYTNGATISFSGISFTISGAPQNNDRFVIAKNTNGVSDNRNALLLAQTQTAKTMAGNTASFATTYAQMVSSAGNKGSEVATILAAQTTLLTAAEDARDSVSGVNLDEEAVNLIKYQQSYQAAAKMLQIASDLFDSILAIR